MAEISDRLAEQFWAFYETGNSYSNAWRLTREWCENEARARGRDPTQSWRSASGRAFEGIAQELVTRIVLESPLHQSVAILRWDDVPETIRNGILSEQVWPKGETQEPAIASSNVDLIATVGEGGNPERVISAYSCKSSVAERYQQDLFWAEKLKARGIRFCFVTIDKGFLDYATGVTNPTQDTKAITLGRALCDRIYLLTTDNIVRQARVFRTIGEVVGDLERWIAAD